MEGERFDSFSSERDLVSVENLLSLDALLADLQNTVSPGAAPGAGAAPGYGSLNGSRAREVVVERYDVPPPAAPSSSSCSPTYQNQRVIHETVTTTKTTYPQSPPASSKMPSLNSNLFELDTLLQDLSNARYSGFSEHRDSGVSNGTLGGRPPSSQETRVRPSVDSLLDELNTAVPNGDLGSSTAVYQETRTEVTGGYPGHTSPAPAAGASSATKELDDLMASLSDFKITASSHQHQTVTDSPYAKPNKATKSSPSPVLAAAKQNQLDSMLGNLQADMSRQGVNTTQKGCCNACDKPIVGQVITALGKTWHPEHFTCNHCNQELGTRNFFERDGHPYCEPDYHNLFSPRCAYCNGPILDKCVTALEKTWHTEHFFCAQCGKQFGEDGFHERDGKPYCRNDYFDMFAPKCGGCNRPIMENYISALNSQWHADCFVCRDCRQPFHGGSFFDHEGLPYCETHYHAKRGSLCAGCHKPITGRCITAMFRKFHPEHFVCAFCLKQLNKGTFKEQNDKPYCHSCFDKLFG
ncbi:paxillin-like isoform X4 [Bacillus rossius redtenbacheri]|uniref:paxillin-like isoform X4 n=1 Tax=Bacillus rossius redtenbacheri TaxID=93214 RepID=UPI002FDD729C